MKISLLEHNYQKSMYNFDAQLSLLKTFDRYGLSASFSEAYDTLDIKGVQLESLGYISYKHATRWANFTQFKNFYYKLFKYIVANGRDLGGAKYQALRDYNFDQVENFMEYENFIGKSYYQTIVNEVVNRLKTHTGYLQNQQPIMDTKEYLGNTRTYQQASDHLQVLQTKNART
jgi:hypothetical protein